MFKCIGDASERVTVQNSHQEERHFRGNNFVCEIHCPLSGGRGATCVRPSLQKGTQSLNEQSCEIH